MFDPIMKATKIVTFLTHTVHRNKVFWLDISKIYRVQEILGINIYNNCSVHVASLPY